MCKTATTYDQELKVDYTLSFAVTSHGVSRVIAKALNFSCDHDDRQFVLMPSLDAVLTHPYSSQSQFWSLRAQSPVQAQINITHYLIEKSYFILQSMD